MTDELETPKISQWSYVPVSIPAKDVPKIIQRAEFVVRDWNGTPIVMAEGISETDSRTGAKSFVISPETFDQLVDYWTRKKSELSETENVELCEVCGGPIRDHR